MTRSDLPAIVVRGDIPGVQSITEWLQRTRLLSPQTFASYRKEANRFVMWLTEIGMRPEDVTVGVAAEYMVRLQHPPEHWVGPPRPLGHSDWKPLRGPLSVTSARHTRTVLAVLYEFLHATGKIDINPFKLLPKPKVHIALDAENRSLDATAWGALWNWVESLPDNDEADVRKRWLLSLMVVTGLRRSEAVSGRMGDFLQQDGNWWLRVRGKGQKERKVAVTDELLAELIRYRKFQKHPGELPSPWEPWPLVCALGTGAPITARALANVISTTMEQAQRHIKKENPGIADKFARLTPHWLRHTSASLKLRGGVPLEDVQQELGHASIATTEIYLHVDQTERHAHINKVSLLGK